MNFKSHDDEAAQLFDVYDEPLLKDVNFIGDALESRDTKTVGKNSWKST